MFIEESNYIKNIDIEFVSTHQNNFNSYEINSDSTSSNNVVMI